MTSHAGPFGLEERSPLAASRRRAAAAMLVFVVLWFMIEYIAGGVFRSVTPWQVVFVRYTIHLALVLLVWGRQSPWRTSRVWYHLTRSALMLVMPAAFVLGMEAGTAAAWMSTIFWTTPLMVLAFAALLDRERARPSTWGAAALGLGAAWMYYAPSGLPSLWTIVCGLAMGGSLALYIPMTRNLRDEPLRTNLFYTAVVPWLALIPLMPRVWVSPAQPEVLSLLFIGSVGLIALLCLDRSAEAAPVSPVAPLLHFQIGLVMSFSFVAGTSPGPRRLAAAAVLFAAAMALAWPGLRRDPAEVRA